MGNVKELICITCPKGCITSVWKEGDAIKIEGRICKKGTAYLKQEYIEPKRVLTTTVVVETGDARRLPVRTRDAIPKKKLFEAMDKLSRIRVTPPIQLGEVILPNLLDTGVDVIATDDL